VRIFFFIVGVFYCSAANAQILSATRINESWEFKKEDSTIKQWRVVNLPHTWNIKDVMDDIPGYFRGVGVYKKDLHVNKAFANKEFFLYFEGANQATEVFINGKKAGHHIGGYTGFAVPITNYVKFGESNEILVKVDNSHNKNIAPLSADFTFFGGIYRDVYLITKNRLHFSTNDAGSNGVYVSTPSVSKEKAFVTIKGFVDNAEKTDAVANIVTTIFDASGKKISSTNSSLTVKSNSQNSFHQTIPNILSPKLWSPENPYLYKAETKLFNWKGKVVDIITNPLGFRWFSFDAAKGFFLNGRPYKLVGASRHQDYKDLGNAVPDELAINDVVLLKNMGANFLRVAHYPQDPSVLKACDSLGLLTSVEIPIVNEISETDSFYTNCENMQVEMIRQGYNHPSVVVWCYMNEVLLRPQFNNDKERQKIYLANVKALAQRLETITRKEDPYRYTMMANHGNLGQYKNAGLLDIPMVIGWNLYSGWYGGSMEEFPQFLDDFHRDYPSKPFLVTEYGADADPRIRSTQPVRFDKSIEYTTRFHQYYLTEMLKRPFVAGAIVWNLADFNSETRTETMPHINNKGLLQWNRTPKDPYYLYQAILKKEPFIKILGSCLSNYGVADSTSSFCYQPVQVASNFDSVTIFLNKQQYSTLPINDGLAEWKLPFKKGNNTVVVAAKKGNKIFRDSITTYMQLQPHCLLDEKLSFDRINIMLGSARHFTDENGTWWQPDQAYKNGFWGSVGGKKFKLENNSRLPYGTDKNIAETNDDPVYQTQQVGIKQYRLDVPPGQYQLTLHFAELLGGKVKVPPYNLNDNERTENIVRRIFNVRVNGRMLLNEFNIAKEYGLAKAIAKTTIVAVTNDEGLQIDFEAVEGEPVLNALQLKKISTQLSK
jgi:beta-galactosidase